MTKFILYLWQLPQNIVALFILLFARLKIHKKEGYWISSNMPGYGSEYLYSAISLGNYIIASGELSSSAFKHEHGHQIQSMYLGPLYLIIVGIPGLIRSIYKTVAKKDLAWYDSGYPENWANKLGGNYENK